jgi:hypothetical protein
MLDISELIGTKQEDVRRSREAAIEAKAKAENERQFTRIAIAHRIDMKDAIKIYVEQHFNGLNEPVTLENFNRDFVEGSAFWNYVAPFVRTPEAQKKLLQSMTHEELVERSKVESTLLRQAGVSSQGQIHQKPAPLILPDTPLWPITQSRRDIGNMSVEVIKAQIKEIDTRYGKGTGSAALTARLSGADAEQLRALARAPRPVPAKENNQ